MRFNRNVSLDDMKGRINSKIVRRCGRRISKIFYKFPVSTDPIKFTEIELVDNEDMETIIALYCGNGSDKNAPIHLFAELTGMEQNEDVNAYGEEHGAQEPCMVAPILYVDSESTIGGIGIDLNITPDIDVVGDDGYDVHVAEFPEYPELLLAYWLAVNSDHEELFVGQRFESKEECVFAIKRRSGVPWRSVYCIRHIAANFHRDYKNADWKRQVVAIVVGYNGAVAMGSNFLRGLSLWSNDHKLVEGVNAVLLKTRHLPIASVFSATFYRLATLMPRMGQQQVDQMEVGHVFVKDVRDAMVCKCKRFETLHYPCAHFVVACAKVNLNVEQFVDDVYTLERTLRIWENEFPVLPDLSTWEVPLTTFELVPDRRLYKNPRGRPQSSRIHNEMDIREKSDLPRTATMQGIRSCLRQQALSFDKAPDTALPELRSPNYTSEHYSNKLIEVSA
ncbi:hypothetical protein GOBAR_DD14325 [Gossypium barbadense]|nr:hypothetical protein GOBAR_DD14325 [Gossypium barbadense]